MLQHKSLCRTCRSFHRMPAKTGGCCTGCSCSLRVLVQNRLAAAVRAHTVYIDWCCRSRKLLDLLQQELAERGNSDSMLHQMTQIHDDTGTVPAGMQDSNECDSMHHTALAIQAEAQEQEAQAVQGSNSTLVPVAGEESVHSVNGRSDEQLMRAASSSTAIASTSAGSPPSTAHLVLAAAMQAYKQEKQQLWKVTSDIIYSPTLQTAEWQCHLICLSNMLLLQSGQIPKPLLCWVHCEM